MRNRVLVATSSADMAFGVQVNLECDGFEVAHVATGEAAIASARLYEAIIVALAPGDRSVKPLLQTVRERHPHVVVIVVTSSTEYLSAVQALRHGAADYLVQPFSMLELVERLRVRLAERAEGPLRESILTSGGLELQLQDGLVVHEGLRARLAPRPAELLAYFIRSPGRVISRAELQEHVWHLPVVVQTRTVDVHISLLRGVLRQVHADYLATRWRRGYAWIPPFICVSG